MNNHCRLVSMVKHPKLQTNADKSELSVSVKPLVPMGADDPMEGGLVVGSLLHDD